MPDPYSANSTLMKNRMLGRAISHIVRSEGVIDVKSRPLPRITHPKKRLLLRLKNNTWNCCVLGCKREKTIIPKHLPDLCHRLPSGSLLYGNPVGGEITIFEFNLQFCYHHYDSVCLKGGLNGENVHIDSPESKYALIELPVGSGDACSSPIPVRFHN